MQLGALNLSSPSPPPSRPPHTLSSGAVGGLGSCYRLFR